MINKSVFRILCMLIAVVMVAGLIGCGGNSNNNDSMSKEAGNDSNASETQSDKGDKQITIKIGDNQPDQSVGAGKLLKMFCDEYVKENPNVKFEFELNDNEVHRQKLKVWASSDTMPDVYMNWCDPASLYPMVKGGYAAGMNPDDFKDYEFLPGALNDCILDGEVYGIPRNFDIWALMYNKQLFEKYDVKVPKTISELKQAAKIFNENGIAPCAMNGKDKWNQVVLLNDITVRVHGDHDLLVKAARGETSFAKEPDIVKAAELLKELSDENFFQEGYLVADYVTAQNLFVQGKAAMFYIGTWEMGMASREDFPQEFKENVRMTFFPTLDGGKDTYGDVVGRTGGIFSVNAKSEVKDEAEKFIKYMFKPENWAKSAWELGILTPAQKWDKYLTGDETPLAKDVTNIFSNAKSTTGQPYGWLLNHAFEEDCKNYIMELLADVITPEQYWEKVDVSAEKNQVK